MDRLKLLLACLLLAGCSCSKDCTPLIGYTVASR